MGVRRSRPPGVAASSLLAVVTVLGTGSTACAVLGADGDTGSPPAPTTPAPDRSSTSHLPSDPPAETPSPTSPPTGLLKTQHTVQVFFSSFEGTGNNCDDVVAVDRQIPRTRAVATAALNELFKGPTREERAAGLQSFFSSKTAALLRSLRIEGRVAYVNLEDTLQGMNNISTSCASSGLLAQLRTTVVQFPGIDDAVFAVEGDPLRFYGSLEMSCPTILTVNNRCNASPFGN